METIEKKAKEFAEQPLAYNIDSICRNAIKSAYMQGAIEQKQYIINKTCEWLRDWADLSVDDTTGPLDEKNLVYRYQKAMKEL